MQPENLIPSLGPIEEGEDNSQKLNSDLHMPILHTHAHAFLFEKKKKKKTIHMCMSLFSVYMSGYHLSA